jgi:hypothetical protein
MILLVLVLMLMLRVDLENYWPLSCPYRHSG